MAASLLWHWLASRPVYALYKVVRLDFLYALLAFAAILVTGVLTGNARPRGRALATVAAALIDLVLIVRLFMTG